MPLSENSPHDGEITIYTDGACSGNPGPAGAGIVMIYKDFRKELSVPLGKATNNIAELSAIKIALEKVKNRSLPLAIYSDSEYAIGVLQGTYRAKKNRELIGNIHKLMRQFPRLKMIKVPGHAGVTENETADRLANLAIEQNTI